MKIGRKALLQSISSILFFCCAALFTMAQPGLQLYQSWQNDQWVNYVEYRNYFDDNFEGCRIDTAEYKLWNDEISQFDRLNLYVNHFDQNGNIIREETQQTYNGNYVGYLDNYKFYDVNNVLEYDSSRVYSIIDNTWSLNGKTVYTYDSEQNLIEKLYLTWMNGWTPSSREQNSYTGLNQLSEAIFSFHNGIDWVVASRQIFDYNGELLLSNTYSQLQNGVWQEQYVNVYTYNGENQTDTCRFYLINPDGSEDLSFLTTYVYDGENVIQVLDQSVMNGVVTNSQLNNLSDYCSIPSSVEIVEDDILSVYPNPANGELFIHVETQTGAQLLIFNMNGQCVRQMRLGNSSMLQIDISDLSAGLYTVIFTDKNASTLSRSFVVE
jgi:hypothetical protein